MLIIKEKNFKTRGWNIHRFFQPAAAAIPLTQCEDMKEYSLPNPLDRYRVPRLVLVPRGFK